MDVNVCCPRCAASRSACVRDGFYFRADDSKYIQRFKCKACGQKFSSATFSTTYRQKKRRINATARYCFASNMCPRDIAELVDVNVKTIASRLMWQAQLSRIKNRLFLETYEKQKGPVQRAQIDDLVTLEHTKCKPLSVSFAVAEGSRVPLGFRVSRIPAFGHLAQISRKKYGKRKDESRKQRRDLFKELTQKLPGNVVFNTDGHEHYAWLIERHFPDAQHHVHQSKRGAIVGQGELKKTRFDPLFSINHTFATARAKVNRLNRRTWCTTKKPERLADHLDIFIDLFCDRLKLLSTPSSTLHRQAAKLWVSSQLAARVE